MNGRQSPIRQGEGSDDSPPLQPGCCHCRTTVNVFPWEDGLRLIYLFIRGPVALAVMVGATFCNGPEVVAHQYDGHGGYYSVGRLTVATVRL